MYYCGKQVKNHIYTMMKPHKTTYGGYAKREGLRRELIEERELIW